MNSGGNDVKASLELLEALDASDIDTLAIVISADQRTQTALRMIRAGAYDYLVTPVNPAVLKVVIERAVEKVRIERENRLLRQEISRKAQVGDLLGSTDAMRGYLFSNTCHVYCSPLRTIVLLCSGDHS